MASKFGIYEERELSQRFNKFLDDSSSNTLSYEVRKRFVVVLGEEGREVWAKELGTTSSRSKV
jgi:hypothetical protein